MIMHLTAGFWIIPFLALATGKLGGIWMIVVFAAVYFCAYFLFKISYTKRTKLDVSMSFNTKAHWAGKEYEVKKMRFNPRFFWRNKSYEIKNTIK